MDIAQPILSLSDRARSVWAKGHVDPSRAGVLDGWLPLHQHLADTASVAGLLWDEWASPTAKDSLANAVGSEDSARALVLWLAGIHDVGKCSPAFAVQVPQLTHEMHVNGLTIDPRVADDARRRSTRHEVVGYLAASAHLLNTHGFDRERSAAIASVVAAHHGNPAGLAQINAAASLPHLVGGGTWELTRAELLLHADTTWADSAAFARWRSASLTAPALVLLSGLVIVADWLASSDYFDSVPLGDQPTVTATARARKAWSRLGFPKPWSAHPDSSDAATLLRSRFALSPDAAPRPLQTTLVEQARAVSQPELFILEAEMGSGKTEAALLAAEILASRFRLSGIFVGLPTRATADGMFGRVLKWTRRLGLETPASIHLAHGTAQLNPEFESLASFRAIGDRSASGDSDSTDESVIAHRWFSSPRRGPLADFVVGTVDQALFAGHRSRYLMLRHLAFASKVVIIDEAHAYDDYMNAYLTRFLEWLGAYGVPVIMLSATLPRKRRIDFHAAYLAGREAMSESERARLSPAEARERRARRAATARERADAVSVGAGYPLLTVTERTSLPRMMDIAQTGRIQRIQLEWLADDDASLLALIDESLRDGGNLAIIRNTVRRAQETAGLLRTHTDIPVTVAHSRFLAVDRAKKDAELLELFGPTGERPHRHIVVATQVIEQSLDVDFDLVVSDIAPIDLLLQRSGRMHRHERPARPAPVSTPRLVLTGVDFTSVLPAIERGTRRVYEHALLLRTIAALQARAEIVIPADIAPLVDLVYDEDAPLIPPAWQARYEEAAKDHARTRTELQRKASNYTLQAVSNQIATLLGWLDGPDIDPELSPPGSGTVRDSNGDTLEVIVLQRVAGVLRVPSWVEGGGAQIPDNDVPDPRLTRTILGCKLRLPLGMCAGDRLDRHIETLERAFELPTWHTSHQLKGELVLVFDEQRRAQLNEYALDYSPDDGLRYARS